MPNPSVYMGAGYIGIGKQSAQGTPVAPAAFTPMQAESFSNVMPIGKYRTGATQGVAYSVVNSFNNLVGMSGLPLTSNYGSQILYLITGGTDTKTGGSDPYTHTLSMANDLPWFTAERAWADQNYAERIQDCKMDSVKLAGKAASMCTLDWAAVGSYNPKQASYATLTYDADPPFMFRDGTFTINGTGSLVTVAGFSIDIKRTSGPIWTNKVYPQFMLPKGRDVAVTLDVLWETTNAPSWYQSIVKAGSTTTPTKVPFSGSLVLALDPGATPDHAITITVSDLREITAVAKLNPTNLDVQMLSISGFAQIPSGGGDEITFVTKNLTSTAYSA